MARVFLEKTTVAAGEISPELYARGDVARYQTGVKKMENCCVLLEGGATRCPGTRLVWELKDESRPGRFIPFEAAVDDAYQLVFNAGKGRVLRNGGIVDDPPLSGTPYEFNVPFSDSELTNRTLKWTQSVDVIFIARGVGGKPQVISRLAANNWNCADYAAIKGPFDPQNLDQTITIKIDNRAVGSGRTLTAAAGTPFKAEHVGTIWRLDEKSLDNVPLWVGNEVGLVAGNERRNAGKVYSVVSGADAGPNPPTHTEGDVASGNGKVTWRFIHDGGGFVRITAIGGGGTTATCDVLTTLPADIVHPSTGTYRWFEPAWTDGKGWPDEVRLIGQRLFWGRREQFWLTKTGDFYDFEQTILENSAVDGALVSPDGKLQNIQWALNAGIIVVGSSSGEWQVRGTDVFDTITPVNVKAVPESNEGSSAARPVLVDGGAIFVGRSRDRAHFIRFDRVADGFAIDDLTLFARHILKKKCVAMAWQRDPHRLDWGLLEDGSLVCLAFRPDQQIVGWSRRPFVNGVVEDIATIPNATASASELWLLVRRTVNGATRRYIEVLQPFFEPLDPSAPTAAGAWFVDSGLQYQGPPVSAVTGLTHLIGQTVRPFVDGSQHKDVVVDGAGAIALDREGSDIIVGIPQVWKIHTLGFNPQTRSGASAKPNEKTATSALVEMVNAFGGTLSCNGATPEPIFTTGQVTPGTAMPLWPRPRPGEPEKGGGKIVNTPANIETWLEGELVGDNAYPFTFLGLSPVADVLGGA